MERINELRRLLQKEGLNPHEDFDQKLLTFEQMLLKTNEVMNLTAITEPYEMMKKHYWDSIYPLSLGCFEKGEKVIDVGCGGGFPSMPLKLMEQDLDMTLMDSLQKRLTFLDGVIEALQLQKIRTLHLRAEDAGKNPAHREQYDKAVSRAVAELSKLCEYCLPLVKVGGALIAYKGATAEEELERARGAIGQLGGKVEKLHLYTLPEEEDKRGIIIIRKVRPTPKQFPRNPKQIKDKPL
ncbi:MAG: 16S rRNA (guanine(527)-N(7))-methyltransferase RsmG [Clostridia bacterium]|nr:16S rRNA (guanine(527)-N(7))-methyltransferase RsmG [Clostridia bacterium]